MRIRIYTMLLGLAIGQLLHAQNREIRFESAGFDQAVKKAQNTGKLVFLDCQTSWCGPCKLMAKEVFTIDSIADFFNANFVCLKMDMEAGEGPDVAKTYKVEAYPTFLLINGEENEVFRLVGQQEPAVFMKKIREGMRPENSIALMTDKYKSGKRDADFIYRYCKALRQAILNDRLNEVTDEYFSRMSMKHICRDENWKIYDEFVSGIDNPSYLRLVDEIDEFKKLKGKRVIEEKLYGEYEKSLFNAISEQTPISEEQYRRYARDIERIGIEDPQKLFYLRTYLRLANWRGQRKYDEILTFIEAGPVGFENERKQTLVMCLSFFADGTPEQRQRCEKLLMREAQAIMAEEGGKLPPNVGQVMGYIQHKLRQGVDNSVRADFQKYYSEETQRLNRLYPSSLLSVDSTVYMARQKHAGLSRFIQYSGLPADSIDLLEAELTMNIYNSLLMQENMMQWIAKIDTILPPSFYSFLGNLNLDVPVWRKVKGVGGFLNSYFTAMESNGYLESDRTNCLLLRAEKIGDSQVRENYIIYALKTDLDMGYHQDLPETIETVKKYIISEENKKVLKEIVEKHQAMAKKYAHLTKGKAVADLEGKDRNGKMYSLKSYKGKVVVIDVWSTNCLPCIAEMKYLHRLEDRFAGKDVVFISYSTDRNAELWMKFLDNKKWGGIQLIDTEGHKSSFMKYYAVNSIPRLIVVGRDGKIANPWGAKPSDPLLAQEIERLLME